MRESVIRDGDRFGRESLRLMIRQDWDGGDPWGSAMSYLGGACDVLWYLGRRDMIDPGAGYSPGAGGPDVKEQPAESFYWEINNVDEVSAADLAYWVVVLNRYADLCVKAGRSY